MVWRIHEYNQSTAELLSFRFICMSGRENLLGIKSPNELTMIQMERLPNQENERSWQFGLTVWNNTLHRTYSGAACWTQWASLRGSLPFMAVELEWSWLRRNSPS